GIPVEETVDQPANKRVAGADPVDWVSRRVADLAARQQEITGFLARRTGHRDERHAVAPGDRLGEAIGLFGKAEDRAGIALGEDEQLEMRRHRIEHRALRLRSSKSRDSSDRRRPAYWR